MSVYDSSKRVDGEREPFDHVFAQSSVRLLPDGELGSNGFLDVVAGVEARGDLHATKE